MKLGFVSKLVIVTIALAVCTATFLYFSQAKEQFWFWAALLFYFIAGLVIGIRTQKAVTSESNSQFFTGVMGGTGIRMFLSLLFMGTYLITSSLKSKQVIIYFLFLYLFYTIFEISQLVRKLRPEKESKVDNTKP
jgi:FlaA1/EpsC-like NDP-sugar epimerase